jgi:Tfp pilus assembly protein PilP
VKNFIRTFASSFAMLLLSVVMLAQQSAAPAPGAVPSETSTEASSIEQDLQEILEEPSPEDSYRYDPQGRRDPFKSLVGPAAQRVRREDAPPGPPGFLIDEIDLQGVLGRAGGFIAMIKGPDNIGYNLQVGDKVFDGEVIRITPQSIVFRQEVNDPTRIERFREVVKELVPQADRRP